MHDLNESADRPNPEGPGPFLTLSEFDDTTLSPIALPATCGEPDPPPTSEQAQSPPSPRWAWSKERMAVGLTIASAFWFYASHISASGMIAFLLHAVGTLCVIVGAMPSRIGGNPRSGWGLTKRILLALVVILLVPGAILMTLTFAPFLTGGFYP